ncbi:hypothetical protein RFI_13219 [Reticulomyxa filosa]|uniref:Uncharacterized protein n=1 Tax=Reticulomyxa filosa TaxID=46433 RepID=X6NDG9_RETFI|nr:hypothetical protein RFI_13219 [Reticulomyxa filosa]|eukprot:ETO23933.1 hypothetical protein RFI_13219 [Reticulomyxa filosa]
MPHYQDIREAWRASIKNVLTHFQFNKSSIKSLVIGDKTWKKEQKSQWQLEKLFEFFNKNFFLTNAMQIAVRPEVDEKKKEEITFDNMWKFSGEFDIIYCVHHPQHWKTNKKRKRSTKPIKTHTQSTTSEKKILSFNLIFKISKKTNKISNIVRRDQSTVVKTNLDLPYLIEKLITFVRHSFLLIGCSFWVLLSCIYLISRKIAISDI